MPSRPYPLVVSAACLFLLATSGTFSAGTAHAFSFSSTTQTMGTTPWDVVLEDLNADGKRDLVSSNYGAGTISVRLGNGLGGFGAKTDYATDVNPATLAIGDVDQDGDRDIVVENWSASSVSVFLGNGAGAFAPKTDYAAGTRPISGRLALMNAGTDLDIVLINRNAGQIRVLPGLAGGAFGVGTAYPAGSLTYGMALGLLNNDALPDAVVGSDGTGTSVTVLLGTAGGGFGTPTLITVGTTPSIVALGDLNADGELDLVVSNRASNTISVLLGNGAGGFGPRTDYPTPGTPLGLAIGDLDADGDADVAVANNTASSVSLFPGNGSGSLGTRQEFATGSGPTMLAIADLDGDGKNELAVAGTVVTVFRNTTVTIQIPSPENSTCPRVAAIGAGGTCCFDVVVRDANNNPLSGRTVTADFDACAGTLCPIQPPGVQLGINSVSVVTNPAGAAHFCICASMAPCSIELSAEGIVLCAVPTTGCNETQPGDSCSVPGWRSLATAGPSSRTRSAMVQHDGRGSIVLFGGSTDVGNVNDLWEWDGASWLVRPGGGPFSRSDHAMAYDKARDRIVLFGGYVAGVPDGQTWEWDGMTWAQIPNVGGPSGRYGHVMAYDEVQQKVMLYGGYNGTSTLGDTWMWNGSHWSIQPTSGPPARMNAALASDPVRNMVVLFGGTTTNAAGSALADTWEWDGVQWTQSSALVGPGARGRHAMVYGPPLERILLSGGITAGGQLADDTWSWDGYGWRIEAGSLGAGSPAMAYDFANGMVTAFGGDLGEVRTGITSQFCCLCDDEAIATDSTGAVIFPTTFDPEVEVTYHDVTEDLGDIVDLYPGFHTSADTWLKGYPCATAIGGTIPPAALDPAWDDSLQAMGIDATAQQLTDSMAVWESQLETMFGSPENGLGSAPPVGVGTYPLPLEPWCPPDSGNYIFGGRDIVFIHGLQLDHVFKRMILNPGAMVDWVPPGGGLTGAQRNFEFYNTGGFYRDIAVANWEPHIQEFLRSRGILNRYLIVTYPCNDRLEVGIQAVLTQINDAMRQGTNVENPAGPDKSKFGTPSFVIVSHSTGGLIATTAMHAARTNPNLNAEFIAARCKAHVAFAPALSGSRLATVAIALTGVLAVATEEIVPWFCPLFNAMISLSDENYPNCPIAANVALRSVLVDLVPAVTKSKWGPSIEASGIRTVTISGGHPTKLGPLKWLNLGFDDAVVNTNSSTGNPGTTFLWPSGFIAKDGPLGIRKTYDMGMSLLDGDDKRADGIFHDQTKDGSLFSLTNAIPFYVSSGPIPYTSPTGMLQSVGIEFEGENGFNPLRRYTGCYSFMASAADHFSVRSAEFYPNYAPTKHLSFNTQNVEESRTILETDEFALHEHYLPSSGYAFDDQPLLTAACTPAVHDVMVGREIRFGIKIFNRRFEKRFWIWKRHYMRPTGMADKHVADYVYGSILACEPPNRDCVSLVDVEESGGIVASATSHPNPSSGRVLFDFTLPSAGRVNLTIVDAAGRVVRRVVAADYAAGAHRVVWDGKDQRGARVAAGVYFWTMRSAGFESTRRLVVVR